jgi:hypothetical protein
VQPCKGWLVRSEDFLLVTGKTAGQQRMLGISQIHPNESSSGNFVLVARARTSEGLARLLTPERVCLVDQFMGVLYPLLYLADEQLCSRHSSRTLLQTCKILLLEETRFFWWFGSAYRHSSKTLPQNVRWDKGRVAEIAES